MSILLGKDIWVELCEDGTYNWLEEYKILCRLGLYGPNCNVKLKNTKDTVPKWLMDKINILTLAEPNKRIRGVGVRRMGGFSFWADLRITKADIKEIKNEHERGV